MIFILIYIVGFILTLTFLKLFGKKMEIDYDPPHEPDYDDYKNNAEAYLFFSLTWIATVPMFTVVVIVQLLYKFSQWFLKYPNV
jgi:ABC-type dipeptide/oligopeptide/nickel transport system permease subunit